MTDSDKSRFYIGTCGYSYPGPPPNGWSGAFYPENGRKRIDQLEFYASYFNSVEINSTFYRPVSAAMARGWLKKTPAHFVFTVKAWQKFTHAAKLGSESQSRAERWQPFDRSDVALFADGIRPLAEENRLGALLFQYPASFTCDARNIGKLETTLSLFSLCPKVVELRHRSWSDRRQETEALLARMDATWAFIDEPKFSTSVKQELTASGTAVYLRLHGRNQQKWWQHQDAWERYDYFYQPENIDRLAERLKAIAAKSPPSKLFVFFNNHARGQAVANALMLQAALSTDHRPAPPQSMIDAYPILKDYFSRD